VTAVTVRVSPVSGAAVSLPSTGMAVGPASGGTVAPSSAAVGESLTGATVTANVAAFESAVPSVARKVNESAPL
jgi:hypothetical protein